MEKTKFRLNNFSKKVEIHYKILYNLKQMQGNRGVNILFLKRVHGWCKWTKENIEGSDRA